MVERIREMRQARMHWVACHLRFGGKDEEITMFKER